MRRIGTLIAIAATAALPPALAPAESRDGDNSGAGGAKSRIVIGKLTPAGAKGTVSSRSGRCERDRRVTLFRLNDFVSEKVEITRTDSGGRWRAGSDLGAGEYFAKVDSITGCRYDVSKVRRL